MTGVAVVGSQPAIRIREAWHPTASARSRSGRRRSVFRGELLPLPRSEVGILHGQRVQLRMDTGGEGPVKPVQLTHQDRGGPSIRHDVMNIEKQDVFVLLQLEQRSTNERQAGEIEWSDG